MSLPIEKKRWVAAAQAEGVSIREFARRAMNERASKQADVLPPPIPLAVPTVHVEITELCACGHAERAHITFSGGGNRGSCGHAVCSCVRYQKSRGT